MAAGMLGMLKLCCHFDSTFLGRKRSSTSSGDVVAGVVVESTIESLPRFFFPEKNDRVLPAQDLRAEWDKDPFRLEPGEVG
jgi:hypothetical protein